jgi:Protein of unknown function (DUF3048) N-terminal domain/Protein of unknown function (DUF3048) C-terminal domain
VALPANPVGMSPLTGRPIGSYKPVLVVKLDNTPNAQPHAGLIDADVVYVEEVEYGITRLAAVFSGAVPRRIGPVRSARITDVDLLAQYGRPAFAYSGAQRKMFPALDGADFLDVSPRTGGAGYSRDGNRRAPYNYYFDGRVGLDRAPKATLAKDQGFVFDEQVPEGGLVAKSADMKWGYSSAGFDYDRRTGMYEVSLNGRRAGAEENDRGQNAATVVIQYVRQRPSPYFDKGGGNTPHADTIGTGKAIVMRDGLAWETTWSRPTAADGTTYTLEDGSVLPFKPGQTWIVLLDRQRKAEVKPLTAPKPTPSATPASTSTAASSATPTASSSATSGTRPSS